MTTAPNAPTAPTARHSTMDSLASLLELRPLICGKYSPFIAATVDALVAVRARELKLAILRHLESWRAQ